MSNRKSKSQGNQAAADDADGRKKKSRLDYDFEVQEKDGTKRHVGLTLHNPTDAILVKEWINKQYGKFGLSSEVTVSKKTVI